MRHLVIICDGVESFEVAMARLGGVLLLLFDIGDAWAFGKKKDPILPERRTGCLVIAYYDKRVDIPISPGRQ
jgi:hypothetical protein